MEMSKMLLQKYGFKRPEITPDQHIFGVALDWKIQKKMDNGMSFCHCMNRKRKITKRVVAQYGEPRMLLEILHKFLFKIEPNYSERFIAILAGITLEGGDPHTVAETIRKQGLINQELLPIPETYEEFCQPNPMEERFLAKGKKWLDDYSFRHDWVLQGKETKRKQNFCNQRSVKIFPSWCFCFGVARGRWSIC